MKVKELIKQLQVFNPELEVKIEYAGDLENLYDPIFDLVASDNTLYLRTEDASAYDDEE